MGGGALTRHTAGKGQPSPCTEHVAGTGINKSPVK